MRVLIAYWDLTVGGVQHMTTRLANELVARGHEVTIALAFHDPEHEPYVLDPRIRRVDFHTQRVREYFLGLTRLLRAGRGDYDVMFSATTVPNIVAVLARAVSMSPVRLVISERDNPVQGFAALTSSTDRLIWNLKPLLYRFATQIICVSTPLADALAGFAKISRSRLTVIHNPAAPEDESFLTSPPPHPWLADKSMPVVIAAGRFHTQKDFPMLIRAFAEMRRARPMRLALLGDGPDRPRIEAAIAESGCAADILLPGMQKDIMPWLFHGDLFAMSSLFEGFGNVLVQALASGCRIVSTDCPDGPAEILDNGRYGALTPVGDAEAMATAALTLLDQPIDKAAQRRRAAEFSIGAVVERYEALFRADR